MTSYTTAQDMIHAMALAIQRVPITGHESQDTSATESFYILPNGDVGELLIEVKVTTSDLCDSVSIKKLSKTLLTVQGINRHKHRLPN